MAPAPRASCPTRATRGLILGVHPIRGACVSRALGGKRCRFVSKRKDVAGAPGGVVAMQRAHCLAVTVRKAARLLQKWIASTQNRVASAETEQVKFKCTASVEFGATMKVVGDSDALGNWEVENGVEMQWSPGDVWTAFVFLRPGTYELKCVKVKGDGSADWEPGVNRVVKVEEIPNKEELLIVDCQYFDVDSTASVVKTFDKEKEETPFAKESAPETVSKSEASGSVEAQVEESPITSDSESKENVEANPITVSEADESDTRRGARQDAAPSTLQSFSIADSEAAAASSNSSGSSSLSQEKGASNTVPIIGLLSVPLVVWSEYTLETTGCGLEPGPGGLIGALEGISYLAVAGSGAWFLYNRISGKSRPDGLKSIAEVFSYSAIIGGLVVLGLQIKQFGFIPSVLPDDKCPAQPTPLELPDLSKYNIELPSFKFGEWSGNPFSEIDSLPPTKSSSSTVHPAPKPEAVGKTKYNSFFI